MEAKRALRYEASRGFPQLFAFATASAQLQLLPGYGRAAFVAFVSSVGIAHTHDPSGCTSPRPLHVVLLERSQFAPSHPLWQVHSGGGAQRGTVYVRTFDRVAFTILLQLSVAQAHTPLSD